MSGGIRYTSNLAIKKDIKVVTSHNFSDRSRLYHRLNNSSKTCKSPFSSEHYWKFSQQREKWTPDLFPSASTAKGKSCYHAGWKSNEKHLSRWLLFFGWMIDDFLVFAPRVEWVKLRENWFSHEKLFIRGWKLLPQSERQKGIGQSRQQFSIIFRHIVYDRERCKRQPFLNPTKTYIRLQ